MSLETGSEPTDVVITGPNTAAAQPNAATTDADTGTVDGGDNGQGTEKTFTQAELDDIVQKRIAKAEAKAERRVLRTLEKLQPQAAAPVQQNQAQEDQRPTRRQGEAEDAYLDRLTDWKLDQREGKRQVEQQQQQAKSLAEKTDGFYAEAQKLAGFDREAFDDLPLTKPMVEALVDSDIAPKLMAYMSAHPEDVERIAKLSPARQAAELGKMEEKAASVQTAKPSRTPPPIDTTGSGRTPIRELANTDNMDDYVAMRKKQGAAWAR